MATLAGMTDLEREAKAEEITRALKAALPAEPARELAVLVHRVATLLRLEADAPRPEPPRSRHFRLSDGGGLQGTVRTDVRMHRFGLDR